MSGDLAMKENLLILNKVLDMAQELIYGLWIYKLSTAHLCAY